MGESRVPAWHAATGLHGENHRVYDAFRELLRHLPMTYTELAARIGVSQPAVSRWASDVSHPSLDEMGAVCAAVDSNLDEIRDCLDRFGEVLALVEQALNLCEADSSSGTGPDPAQRDSSRRELTTRLRDRLGLRFETPPR